MRPLAAILFDLDDTLLDRRNTFRKHLELQVGRHPDVFTRDTAEHYVTRMFEMDGNGTVDRRDFYQRVETELGLPAGSWKRLHGDFERSFPEVSVPQPNLMRTLTALRARGLELGLVTNGRPLIQDRKIDGLGIRPLMDVIVISEVVGFRKPDPRIFDIALSALGVEAKAAAFVGDNPEVDVLGAKRSGLLAIWRRDPFWSGAPEADLIIDDLTELESLA